MKIEIKSLDISNFKGIRSLHLDFHEGVNTIYGDNATGKTTVYDAFIWLMFDKDSQGSSKFNVKPMGQKGVTPEVTAALKVNGEELKLRKVLREKWEKPRGRSEAQYAGDTRDYYIDDVPRKESEYRRIISGYINEEKFKLLTSLYAFARDMHWKDRRTALAEVCGLPDDREILAGAPQFGELVERLKRRTVDDYKAALMSERKNANSTLNTLPIRIDECERSITELSRLSFEDARKEAEGAEKEIIRLRTELAQLDGDAVLAKAQNEMRELEIDLRELESENRRHRESQDVPVSDDPNERLRSEYKFKQDCLQREKVSLDGVLRQIENANQRLEQLRGRYMAIKRERGNFEETCPTCGQPMPLERIEQARKKFETDKQARLDALVGDSAVIKDDIEEQNALRDEKQRLIEKLSAECDRLSHEIAEVKPKQAVVIEDLPDYQTRRESFCREIGNARQRVNLLTADKRAERERLNNALNEQNRLKREAESVLACERQLKDLNKGDL